MTGREVTLSLGRQAGPAGEPLLQIEDLSAQGAGPLTLDLRAGEILGVAGIEGNGQEALIAALAGLIPARGKVSLGGARIDHLTARQRVEAGLGLVPSDRQEDGLVLLMTAAENLALRSYYRRPYARCGVLDLAQWYREAPEKLKAFDVRPPSAGVKAEALSGGNQQKLILAREIGAEPRVLIASQPTRGLDVGATEFVHRRLLGLRDNGHGILLVSLDLDEVLALSDRIAVLSGGRIAGLMPRREADREKLGLLMMGARPRDSAS
jgi:simple sugar transport system ATP-binding protein